MIKTRRSGTGVMLAAVGLAAILSVVPSDSSGLGWNISENASFRKSIQADALSVKAPWTDVRAFIPDNLWAGIADGTDRTDLSPFIGRCIEATPDGGEIVFPPGTYTLGRTVAVRNRSYLRIRGAGVGQRGGGVRLRWIGNGNPKATMIDLSHVKYSAISDVVFLGNSTGSHSVSDWTGIGVYIHDGSTSIAFTSCDFLLFGVGVQVGDVARNESNNENMSFRNCLFSYNTVGYRQLWPNAMNSFFDHVDATFNDRAFSFGNELAGTGSVVMDSMNLGHNGIDIHIASFVNSLTVTGVRSEVSGQFFVAPEGASGSPSSYVFTGAVLHGLEGVTRNPYIASNGNTTWINAAFGNYTEPELTFLNGNGFSTWIFINSQLPAKAVENTYPGWRSGNRVIFIGSQSWDPAKTRYRNITDHVHLSNYASARFYFPASDETPDVGGGANWFYTQSKGTGGFASINGFRNPYNGQSITLICTDANTRIVSGGKIHLAGGADFECRPNSTIQLFHGQEGAWYEISRSVN